MVKSNRKTKDEEVIDLTQDNIILSPEQIPSLSMGDITNKEEALSKIAILLAQPERRKMMSELTKEQIMLLSCLYATSEGLKDDYSEISKIIERFCDEYLELMISSSRKGRREIMKIAASLNQEYERKSLMSRMNPFGWFGRG